MTESAPIWRASHGSSQRSACLSQPLLLNVVTNDETQQLWRSQGGEGSRCCLGRAAELEENTGDGRSETTKPLLEMETYLHGVTSDSEYREQKSLEYY